MTRIGNLLLIIVLTAGLLATATLFALRDAQPSQPDTPTVEMLMVQMGDEDETVAAQATLALRALGAEARPHLQRAARSSDTLLASRARRLLNEPSDPAGGIE